MKSIDTLFSKAKRTVEAVKESLETRETNKTTMEPEPEVEETI